MPPLEGDEEVKSEPEETIAERMKLNCQKNKRKNKRNRIQNFNSQKIIN